MSALVPADLAQAIEREHYAAIGAVKDALGHAIRCGELLTEAKTAVARGEWLPWIEANLPFGDRQARKYMRLAANSEQIGIENSDFTIDGALAVLAARPEIEPGTPTAPAAEILPPAPEPDKPPYSSDSIFNRPFGGSFVPDDDELPALRRRQTRPPFLVHDREHQLAEQVSSLLHRMDEVSQQIDAEVLYRKFPKELRHNLDQALPGAARLVSELNRL